MAPSQPDFITHKHSVLASYLCKDVIIDYEYRILQEDTSAAAIAFQMVLL